LLTAIVNAKYCQGTTFHHTQYVCKKMYTGHTKHIKRANKLKTIQIKVPVLYDEYIIILRNFISTAF
jgi:hypothetical protein